MVGRYGQRICKNKTRSYAYHDLPKMRRNFSIQKRNGRHLVHRPLRLPDRANLFTDATVDLIRDGLKNMGIRFDRAKYDFNKMCFVDADNDL